MQVFDFKSTVVCSEIDLNALASHFGINKKYKWAEPLLLTEDNIRGIIPQSSGKFLYIFYFGSLVFVNLSFPEIQDIINYLKNIDSDIGNGVPFKYSEVFKLEVLDNFKAEGAEGKNFEIRYNYCTAGVLKSYYLDIIATIIAKSVALENVEYNIDNLMDDIEDVIVFLDKGRLNLSDKQLAKMSGKVLRYKYNTISSLMLLDKPDVAWNFEDAEDFYLELSTLFEMKDRYDKITHKSEILLDITEVFTGLTHSKRDNKLEWMVIILIAIELVFFGIETISSLASKLF